MTRYCMFVMFVLAVVAGSVTAFGETTTIVVPIRPSQSYVSVELAPHGIDPAEATVSGALRGVAGIDGWSVVYVPSTGTFERTRFDLFRVESPETSLRVAVVRSHREDQLGTGAGATGALDPGWEALGTVAWDEAHGAYVLTGVGELSFDFKRDGVDYVTSGLDVETAAGESESEITLRPPPPGGGGGFGRLTQLPMRVYQAGGRGDDLWELWLLPNDGTYDLALVVVTELGSGESASVTALPGPEIEVVLRTSSGFFELEVPGAGSDRAYPPAGFDMDATWHRFGNLGPDARGGGALEIEDLRITRWAVDLERQLVAVDDFEAGSWASTWSSPARGALRVGLAGAGSGSPSNDGVLVADLDHAQVVGPDYLVRSLAVPRAVMACRFDLDASSLTSLGPNGVKVFALRDESQQPPQAREYARLLVRHYLQPLPEIRLVTGRAPVSATPWIPLEGDAATIEVQWEKVQAGEGRLDLWIDGCGPDPQACANGWELESVAQPGLVTAVLLGAVGGLPADGGLLSFDDVACVGDSWIEPVE